MVVHGIKHRNNELLCQLEEELGDCTDSRVCAALHGMMWLIQQMSSVSAYYAFFDKYLWMLYEFRLSKCNPVIVDFATKMLRLELDRAQFRLRKMFKPTLEDKWRFISLIPILFEVKADATEYAKFYRSHFPLSRRYFYASFNGCMKHDDFEGMVTILMDYCFLEMARHGNRYSRMFRLPESRFSEYWRIIKQYDVCALEASVTNDTEQFELDYQVTHLVMCRYGYGSRVLAPASKFDKQIAAYLVRHESRILTANDLDLIAEVAYCYLELKIQENWVQKAINKIVAVQNEDGSWRTEEMPSNMYDRLHETWTAVTALCHSLSKQAP